MIIRNVHIRRRNRYLTNGIVREEKISREEAVAIGRAMLAAGKIHHVVDEHDFEVLICFRTR